MTDADSLFEEGYRLYLHAEAPGDLERARSLLGEAALEGHAMALDVLGNMYEDGDGVDEDLHSAVQLYRRSADLGCPSGMYDLALLHLDGRGVKKDPELAFSLIERAVELGGDPDHVHMLSVLYHRGEGIQKDEAKALELLERAAGLGSLEAMAGLGAACLAGEVVEKDPERAFRLLSAASEGQDCSALCNLGLMYEIGIHVEKDLDAAIECYRRAAGLGSAQALHNLALLAGQGIAPLALADPEGVLGGEERPGTPDDIALLGEAYYFGDGVEQDPELAAQYYRAGAELGVPLCMHNLGVMILRGEAVADREGEEYDLILAAANAGYGPAKELAEMSEEEVRACSSP